MTRTKTKINITGFYVHHYSASVLNLTSFTSQVTYGVITLWQLVIKAKFFRAPCRKNYMLDRKMISTCLDGLDVLYRHAKFREDHTTRTSCMCLYVLFFVTLRDRRAVHSRGYTLNRFCVAVYWSILMPFSASYQKGLPFQMR